MNPTLGMFLTEDTVPGKASLPRSLHIYVYTWNNPVNLLDPSGKQVPVPCDDPNGICATSPTSGFVVQTPPINPPPPLPPSTNESANAGGPELRSANQPGYMQTPADALFLQTAKYTCIFLRTESGYHAGGEWGVVKGDAEWRKYRQTNCDEAASEGMEINVAAGPAAGILGTGISLKGEHAWDWDGGTSTDIAAEVEAGGFGASGQIGDHQIVVGGGWSAPAGGPTGHIYLGAALASSHKFLTTAGYFESLGELMFLKKYAPEERIIYRMRYRSMSEIGCSDVVNQLLSDEKKRAILMEGYEIPQVVP